MTKYKSKPTMYKSGYTPPISMWIDDTYFKAVEDTIANGAYEAVVRVGFNVDKDALMKALHRDKSQYEQGVWDMFSLTTSVWYGKECYFLQSDGTVYSRESGKTMSKEDAYDEFLRNICAY